MSSPKPEISPLLLPLAVSKPIARILTMAIGETGLSPDTAKSLYWDGDFFVVDFLLRHDDAQSDTQQKFSKHLAHFHVHSGDVPTHPCLMERLDLASITPQLADAIRLRLHQLTNYSCYMRDLGRPSFLALALVPDWPFDTMNSELCDELEKLLATRGLKPCMKFEQIFEYKPTAEKVVPRKLSTEEKLAQLSQGMTPGAAEAVRQGYVLHVAPPRLTDKQIKLLATPVKDLNLGCEDQLAQFCEVLGVELTMLHVMVGLLAILPADRPTELTDWYEKVGVPLQPWSLDDLHRASEFILR